MKDTIEMAREAGLSIKEPQWGYTETHHVAGWLDNLKRFEALLRADEREVLEKIDWTAIMREGCLVTWADAQELGDRVLAAIRARGNT
jgi:hypothetical protein